MSRRSGTIPTVADAREELLSQVPPGGLDTDEADELAVLGCMVLDPTAHARLDPRLTPASFYAAAHRATFQVMSELVSRGAPLDVLSLTSAMEARGVLEEVGGAAWVVGLALAVPTACNVSAYSARVVEAALRREGRAALFEAFKRAADRGTDLPVLAAQVRSIATGLDRPRDSEEPAPEPLPQFPRDVLHPGVRALFDAFARATESPFELAAVPAMAVFSAALGPRWRVAATRGWVRGPLNWFALVAPPGAAKSPTADPLMAPLVALDKALREEHSGAIDTWKAGGKQGGEPRRRRAVVTDTTAQALVPQLQAAEGFGLLCHSDELRQLLDSLDGFGNRGSPGRSAWLALWNGAPIRLVRRDDQRNVDADRPFAACFGGVQPAVLPQLELRNEDGLAPRFLWSHVSVKARRAGDGVDPSVRVLWERMVQCAAGHGVVDPMVWAADTRALLDERHLEWTGRSVGLSDAGLGLAAGFLGKAGEHTVRLSALLHGLDLVAEACKAGRDVVPAPVPLETVSRAVKLVDYYLAHGLHTARIVVRQGADRGDDQLSGEDARLVDALRRVVPPGKEERASASTYSDRLRAQGVAVSAPKLGKALMRLEANPVAGLRVAQLNRGDGRGWLVAHLSGAA